MHSIANINELDKISNTMAKRLREWYSLYYPELSERIENHEKYIELVLQQERDQETFGADLEAFDVEEIKLLVKESLHYTNCGKNMNYICRKS